MAMSSASANPSGKNTWYYLNSIIALVLMFGFKYLPPIEPLTSFGMAVVGIFLGVVYAWATVSVIWPALLGAIALGFTEFGTVPSVFAQGYGGDTYLFVFFMLIFAAIIDKAGVSNVIASWAVSRKFAKGKPWVLSTMLLTAAFIIAALISVTPAIIICWGILYQLCKVFGYTNQDKYPKLMVIGIVFAGLMGMAALPFKALPVMLMGVLAKQTGIQISFLSFTILASAIGYGGVLGYLALCKFVFRPDVRAIQKSDFVMENTIRMNAYQKQVSGLLGLLVVLLFLPGFLPEGPVLAFLKALGNTGIVIGILALVAFIKRKDGSNYVNLVDTIKTGVPWETMILLGTAMPLATAMTTKGTGVQELLSQVFTPILGANANPVMFAILILVITALLKQFMGGVVVGMLMVPMAITYASGIGANIQMLIVAVSVFCNIAVLLPSAGPLTALLHGNTEWVSTKEIIKYGTPLVVVVTVIGIIISLTLGNLLF
ncbi:SLC13 family permease [Desulfitobacterium chlororespirans]|uniref:Solute carrier family 13 (Sodium-dependent dicarboxylate transporter), member 2/3/5 n=1 Tax=Desulfitobacterium chlororespirans DSM 11544 TaxID=1121395 RepID=A0A1M7UAJ1_9FIRM|nr:SLC13 family permease [Desulfitobacterium chlororespirans]SHN80072.1 solute carrier family 13 (sodium-dependent dicarboxylate transporter), member 2/3/5 [Desulfitobacterium chlororespirans DSM 11544]